MRQLHMSAAAALPVIDPREAFGSINGLGPLAVPDMDLSVADVRARFLRILAWYGYEHLKVGEVTESVDETIVADIVTLDDFLVQRFRVNRHSGRMQEAGKVWMRPDERSA